MSNSQTGVHLAETDPVLRPVGPPCEDELPACRRERRLPDLPSSPRGGNSHLASRRPIFEPVVLSFPGANLRRPLVATTGFIPAEPSLGRWKMSPSSSFLPAAPVPGAAGRKEGERCRRAAVPKTLAPPPQGRWWPQAQGMPAEARKLGSQETWKTGTAQAGRRWPRTASSAGSGGRPDRRPRHTCAQGGPSLG